MNTLSEEKLKNIQEQLSNEQKLVSFDMRELTIEFYVTKYLTNIDTDDNEIYVPDYQREFVWDIARQSRFIESLLLGLPVPFIFTAEIPETGRLEIVDGSQRIRTMAAFLSNDLQLKGLEQLTEFNDIRFKQLPSAIQRMFKNIAIRMIVLSSRATEEVRKEMFDRINTSSVPLVPMETRRGVYRGEFMSFITRLAKKEKFKVLCPFSKFAEKRHEEEELILRFFAFIDAYPNYRQVETKGVAKYLDEYLDNGNINFTEDELKNKEVAFDQMVDFISKTYKGQGFAKKPNAVGVSKPYFEAIAIGIYMALQENPDIQPHKLDSLIVDKHNRNGFFETIEGRYHTHTAKKILSRINYVKQSYLADAEK
ncbi:DUF262 domain-containing protein [Prevotella melaninogenica]|uniref:DUF262 domain-containing protein n=1 Tax=Prevotella melaninogenica TaxID=28132 RepID=UPI001BA93E82|nr:DUF262 domain-containing protein [Prevotella melaninogenica]QUB67008.1 DUF262 domain-containing protein [Prevotella melaninogenica]